MSLLEESLGAKTPIGSALEEGEVTLSYDQKITFELYHRLVLPVDGYVFWVRDGLVNGGLNGAALNTAQFNTGPAPGLPKTLVAQGSLHYSTTANQEEGATYSINRVIFSSSVPVQDLNDVGGNSIYIATFDGPGTDEQPAPASTTAIRFAFSGRGSYYQQAGLWHYVGNAIYSFMGSQIIDDVSQFSNQQIVSNSLPFWLAFNNYNPPYPVPIPRPKVPFYPSFLVPDNLAGPYVAVHINPEETEGWEMAPLMAFDTSTSELSRDRVILTLYGCNNLVASSIRDALLQYSLDTELFGILNSPVPRDDKQTQSELSIIAQKKRIVFDISYNQVAVRSAARKFIKTCIPTVTVGDETVT